MYFHIIFLNGIQYIYVSVVQRYGSRPVNVHRRGRWPAHVAVRAAKLCSWMFLIVTDLFYNEVE
jgi:hypothetical protein